MGRYYRQHNLTVTLNVSSTEKWNLLIYWQESEGSTRHKLMLIHNKHMILNTNDPEQLHYMSCHFLLLSTRFFMPPPFAAALSSPPSQSPPVETDELPECLFKPSAILPAHRISRKPVLLKRQVAAFTRPRLAFLLLRKRPSSGWQKGGRIYCALKQLHGATGPLRQMLGTAKAVSTQSSMLIEM